METCRYYYPNYYRVLYATGLWPYDQSVLTKIQRVAFPTMIIGLVIAQVATLRYVDVTTKNLISTLSFTFCLILIMERYVGIVINFPLITRMFDNMERDRKAIEDTVEKGLVMNHVRETRQVIVVLLGVGCVGAVMLILFIAIPTVFLPKLQLQYLHMIGFYYPENTLECNMVSITLVLATMIGLFAIISTELSLSVFSSYFCGLFEVASYRLEREINTMANSENTNMVIVIRSALELHQHILESVYLAFMELNEVEYFLVSVELFMMHILIMFLNNYSGQKLMNSSLTIFNNTYNSLWYRLPPKSQRMLLFILMKSMTEVQYNLAGLFNPCFEGFTLMMSSSFSYFTALLSF